MCKIRKGRAYGFQTAVYVQSANLPRVERCFAVMFTNIGDTPGSLQGMIVYPAAVQPGIGDSRTFSGHTDDEYVENLILQVGTGGTNPQFEVVQFFYLKDQEL